MFISPLSLTLLRSPPVSICLCHSPPFLAHLPCSPLDSPPPFANAVSFPVRCPLPPVSVISRFPRVVLGTLRSDYSFWLDENGLIPSVLWRLDPVRECRVSPAHPRDAGVTGHSRIVLRGRYKWVPVLCERRVAAARQADSLMSLDERGTTWLVYRGIISLPSLAFPAAGAITLDFRRCY